MHSLLSYRYDNHANYGAYTLEVETIIAELNSGYAVNFNIVGVKTKCNIINKTFHSTLASMKDSEWQVINSDQSIPLNFKAAGLRANDIRIAYLNSICAALRLIHAAGDYISADDPEVAGKVRGYTPENWNRALCLSKFCIRESGASRTKEAGKKGRATAAAKDAPVEIEFLTDEDFATMRDAPADGEVSQADQYNFFAARQALEEAFVDNNDDNVDDLTQCTAEDLKGVDEHATELSKVFTTRLPASVNASVSRKVRSQRPIITKQETLAFCQGLKSRVRINCSADDIDKTRSLDATTSSRNMRIISLGQQEAAAERAAEDGDEAELDDDVKERMHQAALAIKATMTQNSAPHPAYLEACEWVGVDPNTRRFYGSLDHEGDETLPVIELKFWQPMSEHSYPLLY